MTAQLEFWIAEASDEDGDMHWSDIIWGDGMEASTALQEAGSYASCADVPQHCTITVHGPYLTNDAASDDGGGHG